MVNNINKYRDYIIDSLNKLYPNTKTFLNYKSDWQLLFAIILSIQCSDTMVNRTTDLLFTLYPNLDDYNEKNKNEIYKIIKQCGLANNKINYLLETAKILQNEYDGKVIKDRSKLESLPGVGHKTAGVFLAEYYNFEYIPVDRHIYRVSNRIPLVKENLSVDECEKQLESFFNIENKINIHRQLILLGRNICKSNKPFCDICPFKDFCKYKKENK